VCHAQAAIDRELNVLLGADEPLSHRRAARDVAQG
jgi:hypothetical protein